MDNQNEDIEDVQVFDAALSQEEIKELMVNHYGRTLVPPAGLKFYQPKYSRE